jgi:ATP-dependent RNA helicase RhlE
MGSVLIFTRTKHRADRLARTLAREGFEAGVLHGDRSQGQRERALNAFRSGKVRVLVATDLAARGLDVEGVTHVVNFDFPKVPADYIHRVGRTARADAKGDAFALVSPEEQGDLRAVEKEMGASIPRVTLPEFDYAAPPPAGQGGGGGGHGHGHGRRGGGASSRGGGPASHGGARSRDDFWKRVRRRQGRSR